MEIEPLYCDVIVRRWEEFTGRKAERQAGRLVKSGSGPPQAGGRPAKRPKTAKTRKAATRGRKGKAAPAARP